MSAIDTVMPATVSMPASARPIVAPAQLPTASPRSTHMPALDGIRGLAIILVLLHHYISNVGVSPGLGTALHKIGEAGWCGVDLFFVLSGFLITGILYDAKGKTRALINFYGRRVLRLFPLQYGVLIVVLGIYTTIKPANCLVPPAHRIWLWLYASNIVIALKGWVFYSFDHFWSLAVEEQFYFVWPFVVLALSRRTLIRVCIALIIIAPLLRAALLAAGAGWTPAYVLTPCRMDALAFGGLIALLAKSPKGLAEWAGSARWLAAGIAAVLVGIIAVRGGLTDHDPLIVTAGFSLLAIFFSIIVGASSIRHFPAVLFDRPVLRTFGKYSYGIYIFQNPIDYMLSNSRYAHVFHHGSYLANTATSLAVGVATSFAIAWVSWHCYERHFLKLKRYFH